MAGEERPASPEQVPEEARMYLAALRPHHEHPFVRQHFHQVTWLSFTVPGHGQIDFFALEFHVGREAALIWADGRGNWGAGQWLPLSHADADVTCPPSPLSLQYFQGAPADPSLGAAVERLAASRGGGPGGPLPPPAGSVLRGGVDAMVAFLRANPTAEDDAIVRHLTGNGLAEQQAAKLVQFVPIAFTRFLYRSKCVRFAPDYVVLGADGRPAAQRPVADEPAFREAWDHCEEAVAGGAGDDYLTPVAARSGGYRAIQDFVRKGLDLASVVTGPPVMIE
jgi:hypothetical protein